MATGYRPDIEGMRALAIIAVLLCRAGVAGGYVGVDVFFVISGFLITGLLLTELDDRGTISLSRFYARRIRRLLPLSLLLLVVVAALSLLIFSPVRAHEVAGDIVRCATYTANWHFAAQSVDYLLDNPKGPESEHPLVAPLVCSLIGEEREVRPVPGTRLEAILGPAPFTGFNWCGYGLDESFVLALTDAGVVISANAPDAGTETLELPATPSSTRLSSSPRSAPWRPAAEPSDPSPSWMPRERSCRQN